MVGTRNGQGWTRADRRVDVRSVTARSRGTRRWLTVALDAWSEEGSPQWKQAIRSACGSWGATA